MDAEGDPLAIVSGQSPLDPKRACFVAIDGIWEPHFDLSRLDDTARSFRSELKIFAIPVEYTDGSFQRCSSGIDRSIRIGSCHFREFCGGCCLFYFVKYDCIVFYMA